MAPLKTGFAQRYALTTPECAAAVGVKQRELLRQAGLAGVGFECIEAAANEFLALLLELEELRRALGPKRLRALEKARRVEALHRQGLPVATICARIGMSRARVYQVLDNIVVESAP